MKQLFRLKTYTDQVDVMFNTEKKGRVVYVFINRGLCFIIALLASILMLVTVPIIVINTTNSWEGLTSIEKHDAIFNVTIFTVAILSFSWGANFNLKILKHITLRWRKEKKGAA